MHHITLDTGHVRWSPRDEVDPDLFRLLLDHVQAALDGPAPIPGQSGWSAHATTERGILMITASHDQQDARIPVVTVGVVPVLVDVPDVWRAMRGPGSPPGDLLAGGPAPTCLVRVYPTAALVPPADLLWLGDYERCVAWAWIDGPRTPGVH